MSGMTNQPQVAEESKTGPGPVGEVLMQNISLPDDATYKIGPDTATSVATARDWISGNGFLAEPETPLEFARAIQAMPRARAQALSTKWFSPERQHGMLRI